MNQRDGSGRLSTAGGFRAAHREVFGNVDTLVTGLDEAGWMLPTGCPGWSVRDIVAHIAGLERFLIGRGWPDHTPPDRPYIRNDFGRLMEVAVDYRRAWPIADLHAEYREVTAIRLAKLQQLRDEDLDGESQGFFGTLKLRSQLTIRIFDLWSHEQDIRRALGKPGGLDGPAGAHSREQMIRGIAALVQENVAPAPATTIILDVTGTGGALRAITFDGKRGRVVDDLPANAALRLRLDLLTLTVLACGRDGDPGARDRVEVEGDANLAAQVLADLAVTP